MRSSSPRPITGTRELPIDALRAGKDLYVETPLTLKIEEGMPIVKTARDYGRICQVGLQQRSGEHYLQAKREYIDSGKLGKIAMARTWWHGDIDHLRRPPCSLQTKPSNFGLVAVFGSGEVARV
jgi:predicted dehydrogenase